MTRYTPLFSICLLILISACASKNLINEGSKNEFERPINKEEFPVNALMLIEELLPEKTNIAFFQESDGNDFSFEAKFEYLNDPYSIEFSTSGTLQDVEVVTIIEALDPEIQQAFVIFLSEQFSSYSINRLQTQYSNIELCDEEVLKRVLSKNTQDLTTNYELEIEGKNDKELGFFEFLFNEDGQMIQKRRIFKRSFDNVW